MRFYFVWWIVVFGLSVSTAQHAQVDSLLSIDHPDSNTMAMLFSLAEPLEYSDPQKAIEIYRFITVEASHEDKGFLGLALMYSGITYSNLAKMDSARQYYLAALPVLESAGLAEKVGAVTTNIANTYHWEGNFAEAGDYYEKAISLFEDLGDTSRLIIALSNMGAALGELNLIHEAIGYNRRTIALSEAIDDQLNLLFGNHNLAVQYLSLNDLDQSDKFLSEALQVANRINVPQASQEVYRSLADLALRRSEYESARSYANKALEILDTIQIPIHKASAQVRLARAQLGLGEIADAERLLLTAKEVLDEAESLHELKDCHLYLAQVYRVQGLHRLADGAMVLHYELADSLNELSQSKHLAGLERKYQLLKKEESLAQQELIIERQERGIERTRAWGVGLGLALFMALGFIVSLYRQRRIRSALNQERLSKLDRERELSVANAMLQGQESERSRIAKDLHDGLGGLMWSIRLHVERLSQQRVAEHEESEALGLIDFASEEIRRISHDMMPSSLELLDLSAAVGDLVDGVRDQSGIEVNYKSIGDATALPKQKRIAVYRMTQELLRNAVKHGAPSTIDVVLEFRSDELRVAVRDDGLGFDSEKKNGEGIGIESIRSRLEAIGGKYYCDSIPGQGTKIFLTVPI